MHPVIAIDSETEAVLGLLDARIWTRTEELIAASVRARALEDKESIRWLDGAAQAGTNLTKAASVVVVADRESEAWFRIRLFWVTRGVRKPPAFEGRVSV